jgi:hypothetical protein
MHVVAGVLPAYNRTSRTFRAIHPDFPHPRTPAETDMRAKRSPKPSHHLVRYGHTRTVRLTALIIGAAGLFGALTPISAARVHARASTGPATNPPGQTLTVCPNGCAFRQIAPAIAAASAGDTVRVAAGTYAGGFTIDKDLRLAAAGARATVIRGGGPVVTIGTFGATDEPTVSISGVTITGGVTRTSPESTPFLGAENVLASGGGVEIPPNADVTGGATVTISNSVITDNRAAPTDAIASGIPCTPDITITCINGDLPFAQAAGGGIDNWGTLTLVNSTVSNNRIGSASGLSTDASDANGGAIQNWLGPLSIENTIIAGNEAGAAAPDGRSADSGAIFLQGGTLTMRNSSLTDNEANLSAAMPSDVNGDLGAVAGGMHITPNVSTATIDNSTITGNSARMTNTLGDATAFSAGIHVDVGVTFRLTNSVVSDNRVTAATLPGSSGSIEADSGAGEIHGTISNARFVGNTVSVRSAAGDASVIAGASIFFGSMSNSLVRGNHVQASAPGGVASAYGGGLVADDAALTLRATALTANTAEADGHSATAQGGGLFDAPIPNGPPGGPLTLIDSAITENALAGSAPAILQGGGLYIQGEPLTLTNSVIARNHPDQCDGC